MSNDENDFKKLISRLNIDTKPSPAHRENLRRQMLSVFNETRQSRPVGVPSAATWRTLRRVVCKSPITKLAAAAVIIIAALVVIHHFRGSVDLATPAFGKMIEAIKKMPWAHAVLHMQRKDHEEQGEFWYSFASRTEASKEHNGKLTFNDYGRRVAYAYDPTTKQVTISSLGDRNAFWAGSPWELLERVIEELSKNEGAQVTHESEQRDGRNVEIHKVRVPRGNAGSEEWLFIADSKTNLIMTLKVKGYDADANIMVHCEITFDYPDDGPENIYKLGAPRSAAVIDNRTKPEAEEIFNTYKAYCRNAPSRYVAVAVQYHHIERIGADVIDEVVRVYTDGRLQRFEQYQVFDWLEYVDNWPKYSAQMGNTLDSQLKWWTQGEYSGCRLVVLYDGEYNYMVERNLKTKRWSFQPQEHEPERNYRAFGVSSWGWPQHNLRLGVTGEPPITVRDDEYSKQNKLICLQSLWQGKVHKDWAALPCKRLWYLNPQRDYICQRFEEHYIRNAPWQKDKSWLEGVDPERISAERTRVKEVTEFGQTDAGQWYPKRIETGRNALVIFLDTYPEFPEGIFDPQNLPR